MPPCFQPVLPLPFEGYPEYPYPGPGVRGFGMLSGRCAGPLRRGRTAAVGFSPDDRLWVENPPPQELLCLQVPGDIRGQFLWNIEPGDSPHSLCLL